jgi:hypothetical protein
VQSLKLALVIYNHSTHPFCVVCTVLIMNTFLDFAKMFIHRSNIYFYTVCNDTWKHLKQMNTQKNKICSGLNVAIALVYVVGLLCFQRATGLLNLRSDGVSGNYNPGHQSRPWPPQEYYSPGHQSRPWPSQDVVRVPSRRLLETTISPNSTGRTDSHF